MSARSYMPVRARRGRRVHAVLTADQAEGAAVCKRRTPARGWPLEPFREVDCPGCLAGLAKHLR